MHAYEEYKTDFFQLSLGYGDGRHPKLKYGEKIIIIGNSLTDEVSGKQVDIFYGVREQDIDLYYNEVIKTIKEGYVNDSSIDTSKIDIYDTDTYYTQNYAIPKEDVFNRYNGSPTEFEEELYEDYKDILENNSGQLPKIDIRTAIGYIRMYENYADYKKKKQIK